MMTMSSSAKMSTQQDSPAPSTMHNGRQRLRPFLITLIDSGKVKGLQWLDKEKTLFKIPWKHAGKQDYDPQEDSKIFMLWSRNTGKYKEGIHEPEPAVWKTRLRTALNKLPDIEEIHEKTQLDIPEPYRVYKLLPKKTGTASNNNKAPHHEYNQPTGRPMRPSGGSIRPSYHPTSSYPPGMECPEMPHPSYPSHYFYDYSYPIPSQNMCDIGINPYAGFSANGGLSYHSHIQQQQQQQQQQQSVISNTTPTSSSNRHHPYHTGHHHRPSHNSSSSVDDLGPIVEVINDDMGLGNLNDHGNPHLGGHHYTNMDNMDVDIQMKLDSNAAMHQFMNNNDPNHMNYHDPTSVTSSGMTAPYSSPPAGGVPLRPYSARTDYDQQASPPSAMNAITMASNVLSGEDEGLEACTASVVMNVNGLCRRPSIKDEAQCLPSEHEMGIQLYYRSFNAGNHHIDAEGGCMLFFREPYEAECRRNMQLIPMPDIKNISETDLKGKPREYISKILDCCDKGLSLVCRDGCIYVKRHCRSVLFWNTSEDSSTSEKLERDVETKVFDLTRFRHRLRQYYEGAIPSPVVPEIYFSIAQRLTDAVELKACFITFVVRPLRALEELRTINSEARSLPHSTHSGLLRFSGPDMHGCGMGVGASGLGGMNGDVFTAAAAAVSVSPLLAQAAAAGLGPWGDISPYAASCPMVPQPTATQVN